MQYDGTFSVWHVSLSIMSSDASWSIHIVVNSRIPFSLTAESYSVVCVCDIHISYLIHIRYDTYHIFIIHSSIDRYLGCFHILVIVENAAINRGVQVSFWYPVFIFFGYVPKSGILPDHMVVLFLDFWRTSILFSIGTEPIYIPPQQCTTAPFSPHPHRSYLLSPWR